MKFEVGKLFREGVVRYEEGCRFDITDAGGELYIYYNSPTKEEIDDIGKPGKYQCGYYKKENVIFMLFKFGEQQWLDCPYNIFLSKKLSKLEHIEEGKGIAITIYLVDAATGILRGLRLIGLNTRMSKMLRDDIIKQSDIPFNKIEYGKTLNSIYNKLSTKQMVDRADCICKFE